MRERPILFSSPMVRAILAGTKTQTRRIIKPQPSGFRDSVNPHHVAKHPGAYFDCYCGDKKTETNPRGMGLHWCWWTSDDRQGADWIRCPFGVPGDRLWVRETWRTLERESDHVDGILFAADGAFAPIDNSFDAADKWVDAHDNGKSGDKWRPSIFMRRWMCRITLEVTNIRVERLQDITEEDAKAEGVTPFPNDPEGDCWTDGKHRTAFEYLWDQINRDRAPWSSNPWVWVVEFKRAESQVTQ